MTLQPMLAGFFGGWEIVILAMMVGILVFWIWMIVDCVNCEKDANTRTTWLLVTVLAGIIGALLYYFIRKLPRETGRNQV
jgi:prolipoprotein diacylglyceryltransferase